jgi:hypothetical protein
MRDSADCARVSETANFTIANLRAFGPAQTSLFSTFFSLPNTPRFFMKKLATSVFVLLLTAAVALSASAQTIRRVSTTATGTNIYATFALAQTAAATGDIIQMEPGNHADITLTKNLTVVGPGYFLGTGFNTNLQANSQAASMNYIYFGTGSAGASVAGLQASQVYIGADNVTLQRCYVTSMVYLNYGSSYANVNNVNIRQNYLAGLQQYSGSYTATNILVTGNIFTGNVSLGANVNGELRQNTFGFSYSTPTLANFNVTNNYFGQYYVPAFTNCTVRYNAFYNASVATTDNNQNNVQPTNVLANASPTFDAHYQLKTGTNVLRGTGENGLDIGAFAGNSPYKLGGLPAIPAIYQLSNSVNGNTLNVNLSTRSNN